MTVAVDDFRALLKVASPFDIVRDFFLNGPTIHVSDADIAHIGNVISASFGLDSNDVEIIITGSAKIGFSLSEKRRKDQSMLPRYRLFSPESDIDVAVVSQALFSKIWIELAAHYSNSFRYPPDTGHLGDYMTTGWLRPDHFPRNVRLPMCDNWMETFSRINRNSRFRMRRLNGGIFQSKDHLMYYIARSVRDCIALEVAP